MLVTTLDAKAKLETEGLHVSSNNAHSLWIAATVREAGNGVQFSDDACSLRWDSDRWVAVFPAEGLLTYELPGTLPELVAVILTVYNQHRRAGGAFRDAVKHVIPDPQRYLVGRTLAHV